MKKLKLLFSLLVLIFLPIYGKDNEKKNNFGKEIPVVPHPIRDNDNGSSKGPRIPARNPLTVLLMGDCISVTCDYEANGKVEVYDNYSGIMVAADEGELSTGLMLILSEYHEGSMEIQITLDNKIYRGIF